MLTGSGQPLSGPEQLRNVLGKWRNDLKEVRAEVADFTTRLRVSIAG